MKKKPVKKLVLAKETLRSLVDWTVVQGGTGGTTWSCPSGIDQPPYHTCWENVDPG
jgi:hypothetical protein